MLGNNYGTNGGSFGSVNERASSSEPPRTVIDTSQPTCSFRYLFSFNGILKLLAVSSTLMALVFVLARTTLSESYTEGTSHFTLFASATGAVYSGILLLLCICHFSPWAALEAIFSGLHSVTLGIAGGLMIPYFQKDWRRMAAAVFCFIAAFIYAIEFCHKLRKHCAGRPREGAAHPHVQFQ